MAVAASLPVFMRVGLDLPEVEIGQIEIPANGDGTLTMRGADMAKLLRAAADVFERTDDEEVSDAAPHE